ncbi:MAG: hypothetical protein R3199_10815 [Gemmatimonadota bacterium]|nr:hypothetical protein [Gemmatimonadota bacterium]
MKSDVKIDPSKLLGYRLLVSSDREEEIDLSKVMDDPRIGAKIGDKIGVKPG